MRYKNKEAKDDSGIAGLFADFFFNHILGKKGKMEIENTLKVIDIPISHHVMNSFDGHIVTAFF